MDMDVTMPTEKNIILTGFMGVGKTTVGRHLAAKFNREFIDADQAIEKKYGMPIPLIFETLGEPRFRQMEKNYIIDLCKHSSSKIVSLGGGAFLQDEIREACLTTSFVFFLEIDWTLWKDRMYSLMEGRPLLQGKTMDEVKALFDSRQEVYSLSHYRIDTNGLESEEVAERIMETLRK